MSEAEDTGVSGGMDVDCGARERRLRRALAAYGTLSEDELSDRHDALAAEVRAIEAEERRLYVRKEAAQREMDLMWAILFAKPWEMEAARKVPDEGSAT